MIAGLLVVSLASWALTGWLRRYALKRSLMDIPNARSSHSMPTPRGGGVAIVGSFLAVSTVLAALGPGVGRDFVSLAGAGALVATLGFMDDHGHIAARWRLLGHFSAGLWALCWLGGMPDLVLPWGTLEAGWLLGAVGLLYLVWMLNLYNFMDGIDGIASVQALTCCLGVCVAYALGGQGELIGLPLLLAAAVAGFLLWNFPRAKIFMGDAGSGFLGITLAVLSLQGAHRDPQWLWVWLIMMGVFIVDASFTLIRRLLRGDKVYEAHRSHGYQFASRHFGSHLPVTLAVALINLGWLLPIVLLVVCFRLDGLFATVVAYVPLVYLARRYQAGALEAPPAAR